MNAVKIQIVVPENREVKITLPPEIAPGAAEVIVLAPGSADAAAGVRALLELADDWRAGHAGRRSKEEIDHYVEQERAAWGDGG